MAGDISLQQLSLVAAALLRSCLRFCQLQNRTAGSRFDYNRQSVALQEPKIEK